MIPRIIHQTYKSNAVPDRVRSLMASWTRLNPGWEVRFYDDQMCREFVRTEFPEYYQAYLALPKDVERSDFFRYLIVLHVGGVYADIDCECRAPLDRFLRSADTLVVGWEGIRDGRDGVLAPFRPPPPGFELGLRRRAGHPGAPRNLRPHRALGAQGVHEQHQQGHARAHRTRRLHRRRASTVLETLAREGRARGGGEVWSREPGARARSSRMSSRRRRTREASGARITTRGTSA